MRARISLLSVAIVLAGCASGTRTVYVIRDRPVPVAPPVAAPAPAPAPASVFPLEIALGRPSTRSLPVQTNRAAYVAIFEITPKEGVVLVHPTTPRQARMVLSGLSSVPVWWESSPGAGRSGPSRAAHPTRYIYALASEQPLRLLDSALVPGYLERVLGPAAFRAAAPQPAMRALSRRFAPAAMSGKWAEDLYTLAPATESSPRRVARIYCTGGTVYEVPEDIADRAWCPTTPAQNPATTTPAAQPNGPAPARPDSVLGPNGQHIGRRAADALGRAAGRPDRDPQPGNSPVDNRPATPVPAASPVTGQPGGRGNPSAEKAERERNEREKAEKERVEKERADHANAEKDKAVRDKADKERADQAQAEADRVARARADQERVDKERVEAERVERARAEKETADRAAKEKSEREKTDREAADSAAARERAETERVRVEKEKAADEDKAATAKAEKEKTDKAEKEKAEKEKADSDKAEKEKADKAKLDSDKAEKDKAEKEKSGKPGKAGPPNADGDSTAAEPQAKGKAKGKRPGPPLTPPTPS